MMDPERPKSSGSLIWLRSRLRQLVQNPISLAGIALSMVSLANILVFFVLDSFSTKSSPYIGILAYMVAPAFLIVGLVLIVIGMWRQRRIVESGAPAPVYPRIDFNDPSHRSAVAFFGSFLLVFVMLSAVGSYRAYEFTDSVQFCGQLCHTVMSPEYTTYLRSPHARVACVECHVGPGAGWYVRSKLSGSYQVYSAAFHKYPRPITTPVANLRPAQQTCEQCHWPSKFYGAQLKVFYHFGSDETNTPRQIRMLINTGGAEPQRGNASGIHWHMNIANKITYISTDAQHQTIPWVQVEDRQGHVTVYQSKSSPLPPDKIAAAEKHVMDCIDCHNRPSHIFTPPDRSVDDSLYAGRIDATLPYIKQQAVTALTHEYATEAAAQDGIAKSLEQYYEKNYPDVVRTRHAVVENAVADVQNIYRNTIFPYMKVDWRTHPTNIGHFYSPGCFRCHDGDHVSSGGKVVTKQCNICHVVLAQLDNGVPLMQHENGIPFTHPIDLGDLTQVNCNDCHTGGEGP